MEPKDGRPQNQQQAQQHQQEQQHRQEQHHQQEQQHQQHQHAHKHERKAHHTDKMKSDLISRLNRIEGQVRGIKGLIEKDTYCDDVLHQIAAVQSALNGVGKLLLAGHLKSCVVERIQEGDMDVVEELLKTMNTLMK